MILLATLLASMLAMAGLLMAAASRGIARCSRISREVERERVLATAESGIDVVQALLNSGAWGPTSVLDWSTDGVDNDDDGLVDEGDESLRATADLWASDGNDNDGDALVDEEDEGIARVTCQASSGTTTDVVTGWLVRIASTLPDPMGATYLNDPLAQIRFTGNAFEINGNDQNTDYTAGPSPSLYGIGVNGDPSSVMDQMSSTQLDNVVGLGGVPSVGTMTPTDPLFIYEIIDQYAPLADRIITGYSSSSYTGNLGNWDTGDLQITYSPGDLQVSGGATGAGILIVDGDLRIFGGWSFKGYIFIRGNLILKGSANRKRLMGAVFIEGDVDNNEDLTINGAANIYYSSEVLQVVRNRFSNYRRAAIVEG
jgi:hypothetical protein